VAGERVLHRAIFRIEDGDGAIRGGGCQLRAVGRPSEVDGVVFECNGPVFDQLHGRETC
jgi:hypothetical protein